MYVKDSIIPIRSLAVAALALGVASCGEEVVEQTAPVVRPIRIIDVTGPAAGEVLEYPGAVEAAESADLSFEVAGRSWRGWIRPTINRLSIRRRRTTTRRGPPTSGINNSSKPVRSRLRISTSVVGISR